MAGRGLVRIQGGACRDSPPRALGLLREGGGYSRRPHVGGEPGPVVERWGKKTLCHRRGEKHRQFLPPFIFIYCSPLFGWMGAC